jgi:hypothetical protein
VLRRTLGVAREDLAKGQTLAPLPLPARDSALARGRDAELAIEITAKPDGREVQNSERARQICPQPQQSQTPRAPTMRLHYSCTYILTVVQASIYQLDV